MIRQLVLALLVAAAVSAAAAQPMALDSVLERAANPRLATAPDGSVHLFTLGTIVNSYAAVHRVWQDGEWGEETVLDIGDVPFHDPALAVGADGTMHAVWIADGRVAHASLGADGWSLPTIADGGVGHYAEFPSVAARPDGGAEIAWQTLRGSDIQIAHASVAPDGQVTGAALVSAQGAGGYGICPQIFLAPQPILCWYEAESGDLALRTAEHTGGEWSAIPLDDLLLIDANRLPTVLWSDLRAWAALWQAASPRNDRIFLGLAESLGEGQIVDGNPGFDNTAPEATNLPDGRYAVTWRGVTPEGPEIFFALETADGWQQSMLTGGMTPGAAQPAIAAGDDGVHVVWASDPREGGTGHLVHLTFNIN